jgi:hypothetical protein
VGPGQINDPINPDLILLDSADKMNPLGVGIHHCVLFGQVDDGCVETLNEIDEEGLFIETGVLGNIPEVNNVLVDCAVVLADPGNLALSRGLLVFVSKAFLESFLEDVP